MFGNSSLSAVSARSFMVFLLMVVFSVIYLLNISYYLTVPVWNTTTSGRRMKRCVRSGTGNGTQKAYYRIGECRAHLILPAADHYATEEVASLEEENEEWREELAKDQWVSLGKDLGVHLYSAWHDPRLKDRAGPAVRLVGASRQRKKKVELGHCVFWFREQTSRSNTSKAGLFDQGCGKLYPVGGLLRVQRRIEDHHGYMYAAFFYLCYQNGTHSGTPPQVPEYVSLMSRDCAHASPPLRVHPLARRRPAPTSPSLAVCVKPVHGGVSAHDVAQFVELYRLLGVDTFYFYLMENPYRWSKADNKNSAKPEVHRILRHYAKQGFMHVSSWKIPLRSRKDIHTVGIIAALNDCIYRTMYHHNYTAMVDVDEFLMPLSHETLPAMIQGLNVSRSAASLQFRNTFFFKFLPKDQASNISQAAGLNLFTLKWTLRTAYIWPDTVRSKMIIQPQKVLEVINHYPNRYVNEKDGAPPNFRYTIQPEDGLLFHYRGCHDQKVGCNKFGTVRDRTVLERYQTSLINNVQKQLREANLL